MFDYLLNKSYKTYLRPKGPGINFINLFTRFSHKEVKSHFRKHFCMKFVEVDAVKNVWLVKRQFAADFSPFTFCQSLMKLIPGGRNWQLIYANSLCSSVTAKTCYNIDFCSPRSSYTWTWNFAIKTCRKSWTKWSPMTSTPSQFNIN